MLAEMAAFNAAFGVVKSFVQNGKDIQGALGSISNMIGAEEDLRAKGNRKKSSTWSKLLGKTSGDDFEEFQSLENIKEQRKELQSLCRLYAKPGTWDRFLKFEAQQRKKRRKEAEERERAIARTMSYLTWGSALILSLGGFVALYYFTEFLKDL